MLDYKHWSTGYYLTLKITLKNKSLLFTKEYVSEKERNYSYHWQDFFGNLIIRWDNAPHHKHIKTFPHHKHIKDLIAESAEMGLPDVLSFIAEKLRG